MYKKSTIFKIKTTLFLFTSSLILIGCSESDSVNHVKSETSKQEENFEEYPAEGTATFTGEVIELVYDKPTSPIHNTTDYVGYIANMPIEMTLNEHDDDLVSGSYYYDNPDKKIELIGTIIYEHCGDYSISIAEWPDSKAHTGTMTLSMGDEFAVKGEWFLPNSTEAVYPIRLKLKDDSQYISPLSNNLFRDKYQSDDFYANHKFVKNASLGKEMVIVRNTNNYSGGLLPSNLMLYEKEQFEGAECGSLYELKKMGVIKNNNIELFEQEKTQDIYRAFTTLHSTPGDEVVAIRASNLSRDHEGRLCVQLGGDLCLTVLVSDLEYLGYHLEGDAYYLKNTMKIGLDANYRFDENNPLTLFKKPNIESDTMETYKVDDGNYFMIEDVVYYNMQYWFKVNVYNDSKTADYHDINNSNILKTGWIELYIRKDDQWDNRKLSLTYYGNGC